MLRSLETMAYTFGFTRNKCKSLTFLTCAAIVYVFVLTPDKFSLKIHNETKDKTVETSNKDNQSGRAETVLEHQECPNTTHIYYVKIHKTGSSTFQNILYRLGMRQDLVFALIGCAYGMSYPHPAKQEYLFVKPNFQGFDHYDLLTDHSMFHSEFYKAYMPSDTKVITLMRHPLNQLKSTFGFWNLPAKFEVASSTDEAMKTYLENPEKYEQTRNSFGCPPVLQISQTRNPQSHHLGLEDQSEGRQNVIEDFVKGLDEQMDLVMILEHFEESLILFKRLFCLSTRDILHLHLFSTSFFNRKTYDFDDEHKSYLTDKHREWSTADYMVYDHFTSKLKNKITQGGQDFMDELLSFRETKEKVRDFCSGNCDLFETLQYKDVSQVKAALESRTLTIDSTRWSQEFSINAADCLLMMFETLMYDEAIKAKQWPAGCPGYTGPIVSADSGGNRPPRVNPKYCNKQDHFVPHFSWEAVKNSAYFRKTTCLKNF